MASPEVGQRRPLTLPGCFFYARNRGTAAPLTYALFEQHELTIGIDHHIVLRIKERCHDDRNRIAQISGRNPGTCAEIARRAARGKIPGDGL
jgi:hypothetical protein